MRAVWDGFLSLLAAAATLGLIAVPLWAAWHAVDVALVPVWVYAPMAGLGFVGAIMAWAFLRKAAGGIAPLGNRRR